MNSTTELEAVNQIIASIGEAPFSTLDGDLSADAALARSLVNEVSRTLQLHGWSFNTEREYSFSPDDDGKIIAPSLVKATWFTEAMKGKILALRGDTLYDRKTKSDVFTGAVTADEAVFLRDWDELPEPFKQYVIKRASRVFGDRNADAVVHQVTDGEERAAKIAFLHFESETEQWNMADGGGTQQVVRRYIP